MTSPNTSKGRLPFAAAATATTLSRLITRSATIIVPTAMRRRSLALTLCSPLSSSATSLTPIQSRSAAPTSLSHGYTSRLIAKNVSRMRNPIAPSTPQKIPYRRCRCDRLRQASAITTALSPESRMLTRMISATATQNCGVTNSATAGHSTDCSSSGGSRRRHNWLRRLPGPQMERRRGRLVADRRDDRVRQ